MHRKKSIISLGLFLAMAILVVSFRPVCADAEEFLKYSIHESAERGDLEDVKNHLRRGTAVNLQDQHGDIPLHYAAAYGQTKVAEFLIKKGADVNAETGQNRMTPLELAAQFGFKDMVELLIKKGADIKKYGPNGINLAVEWIKTFKKIDKEKVPPHINLANIDHIGVVKVLIKNGLLIRICGLIEVQEASPCHDIMRV